MQDTLRTHIRGVLSRRPGWSDQLAPFEAEAAWITGDWSVVESLGTRGPPLGPVLLALHHKMDSTLKLREARLRIGQTITSRQYHRAQDAILQLHLLHEIEMIRQSNHAILTYKDPINHRVVTQKLALDLINALDERFETTSPLFHVREAILTIRRSAFALVNASELRFEIGQCWIQSSKIARRAGYEQTAYSAALQAGESDAPFAFLQQVKLLRVQGGAFKALTTLENSVNPLFERASGEQIDDEFARDRQMAKVGLQHLVR